MSLGITLISLCIAGIVLAVCSSHWTERRRMISIITLLLVMILALLASH